MAAIKKVKRNAKHLRRGKKLEEQKPLTKVAAPTPTETMSLPYSKIEFHYESQK
jgi:type VI protein secretion system component Hcp